jgi:archaemetzincin
LLGGWNTVRSLLSQRRLSSLIQLTLSRRAWLQACGASTLALALPLGCEQRPSRGVSAKQPAMASGGQADVSVPQRKKEEGTAERHCDKDSLLLPIGTEVPFDEKSRAFEPDRDQFEPKHRAQPGEWLARFKETGLTFDEYVALRPTGTRGERHVIVLQPLGAFTAQDLKDLKRLATYTEAFFYQPVRIAPVASLPRKGQRTRQERGKQWVQHHTRAVLEMMAESLLPNDAICTLGVTLSDLYPEPTWNYVFGEATLEKRVGVYSLARYRAQFWGEPETLDSRRLATLRSFKVLAHEAGHMFSLVHCRRFECLMNGSNSLEEMDRSSIELCPICLKMLQYNLRFDVRSRYRRIATIYDSAGLTAQRDWIKARLERIGC